MKCKDCAHAYIGKDKSDIAMSKMGYKSCKLAITPVERGRYVRGVQECFWPERIKK